MPDITHIRGHVDLFKWAKVEQAKLKEIETGARAAIEEALGDADEGFIDGQVVVRRKHIKSNKLDQKLLDSLYPDVLAECKSISESTRFEVE